METCFVNLVEPGDRVLVGRHGARMIKVARRSGAEVTEVEGEWGRALDPDAFRKAAGGKGFRAKDDPLVAAEAVYSG